MENVTGYTKVDIAGIKGTTVDSNTLYIKDEDLKNAKSFTDDFTIYEKHSCPCDADTYFVDSAMKVRGGRLSVYCDGVKTSLKDYLAKRYEVEIRRTADALNELPIISELFGIPIMTASQVADKALDGKYIKLIHHDNWRIVEVYVLKNEIELVIDEHKMHGTGQFEVPGYVKEDGCFTEKYAVNFVMTNWKLAGVEIKPFEEKDPIPTVRVQLKNAIIRDESLIRWGYVSKEELDKIFEKYDEKDLNRYPVVDADKYPMIDVFEDIYGRIPLTTKPIRDLKIDIEYRVKDAITYIDKLMYERKDD